MWDEYGPGPIDSYDAYTMGLRPARCNGCKFAQLKHELGDKFLHLQDRWQDVYELDANPIPGQGKPLKYEGRPIRFRAGFMSIGHSDECYHWKPPAVLQQKQTLHPQRQASISRQIGGNIARVLKRAWRRRKSRRWWRGIQRRYHGPRGQ